jgi:tetratricopeptide (TPR) repeat protein
LVVFLLVIAAIASGWWLWRGMHPVSPQFRSILIKVNRQPQEILSGETCTLHPTDKVKILKISTNVFFNLGVRLVAKGFDVNALRYKDISLSSLLPDQEAFDLYKFQIWIKYQNQDLGYIVWEIQPFAEDWLDKAARAINSKKRLAVLESGLRFLPGDKRLNKRLLEEYKTQKKWKQAASMLKEIAGKQPDPDTLVELLEVYTAMHNKDGMISVLKKLIKLDPEDMNSRSRLAELLEERGRNKAAIKEYEALLKRFGKNDRLSIYKRLGYLYTKTGQSKKAIPFYLKAAELDKKDANLYYNLSFLYGKINKKEKSDFYLGKAVNLKSGDIESRLKLALKLIKKGKVKKAKKYLLEVLNKKPKSLKALFLMSNLLEKQGKKRDLKKTYKKILSLDPKNKTVRYNLGALEYETGNLKTSLYHFKRYLKLKPKDATAHRIIFDIYKKQKNTQMAFKEAEVLVKLKPKDIDPYYFMFDYLNSKRDYGKIIHVMERGLKANPKQIDLRKYLVFAYLKTGKEALATKQIEAILKARPKDVDLLLHLARLREKQEKYAEALKAYKKIIEISPDHEEAEESYLRLRLKGVRGE